MNSFQKTLVGVGTAVVVVAVPLGLWAGNVLWSGPAGTANVYKQNNDGNNRINAQNIWQTSYDDVNRSVINLKSIRVAYKTSDPQGMIISAQSACSQDLTHYNGLHTQPLLKDWQPASLPVEFDASTCN